MSMTIEEALVAYVNTVSPITAIIGTNPARLYPSRAPDKTADPYIVYTKSGGERDSTQDGNSGFGHPRVQLSCWSANYKTAKKLAVEVVKAFNGYLGPMGDKTGVAAFVDNEIDNFDTEAREHHIIVDVMLWHTEDT